MSSGPLALLPVAVVVLVVVAPVVIGVVALDGFGEAPCRIYRARWVLCGPVGLLARPVDVIAQAHRPPHRRGDLWYSLA